MKRIYLLMVLSVAIVATSFAQNRHPNMHLRHSWGKTSSTDKFMEDGDKILASGGNDAGVGKTNYYFSWEIINNGSTATDTVAVTDSIIIRAYALRSRIMFNPSQWGTGSPTPFPLGMKQKDTIGVAIANATNGMEEITPTDNFPPSLYPDFVESTTYDYEWCDSVYLVGNGTVPTNMPAETDFSNNMLCHDVKLTLWNTGVNTVIQGNGIMMFPNPAYNKISLRYDFGVNATANVTVVDITGKVVYQQELGSNISGMKTFNLDLAGLTKGLYILKLNTNDKVVTHRFDMM